MREIVLIDTSIFCHILRVPGKCSDEAFEETNLELAILIGRGVTLLLPMATIYETGNHIAQNGNGEERRKATLRFERRVRPALNGMAPWSPTPLPSAEQLNAWLQAFPTWTVSGVGIGDLSIIDACNQQREAIPTARVRIWSLDGHLSGYDYMPSSPWLRP